MSDIPPYGSSSDQPPPAVYGAHGSPGGYVMPTDHPQASTVLILGIVGLVVCGLVGPFAWVMGNRVVREIDASGGRLGGRSAANAGRILGIVGTVVVSLSLLFVVGVFAVVLISLATSSTS